MKIGIISAKTGNGHISVANALKSRFDKKGIRAEVFNSFYEDLMVSNKIISDYYNFLMVTSTELCCKFSELSYLTRPDLSENFYSGVRDGIISFIKENNFDKIVSTSHTVNHAFIRALKELGLNGKTGFYIVITDPFVPISVGFDIEGATKYYCASSFVEHLLRKKGIDEKRIVQTAYPVNEKFLRRYSDNEIDKIYKSFRFDRKKKVLLINSGSQGAFHYNGFLKSVLKNFSDLQVIFICGKNESLYTMALNSVEDYEDRARVLGYVENIEDVIRISDIVLTKPGANTFFECIYMQKPLLIDGMNGFLFQEKGVLEFLKSIRAGMVIESYDGLLSALKETMEDKNYTKYKQTLENINVRCGAEDIAEDILKS